MRRLIPHSLLAAMTVLALGAMLLSVQSAARISVYATPPAADPGLVASFHAVIQRTLDAPNYTYNQLLDYQSPDRVKGTGTYSGLVIVGPTVYLQFSTTPSAHQWGSTALTTGVNQSFGPALVTRLLHTLLTLNSVVRQGSNYVAEQVVAANDVAPGNPGDVLISFDVGVSGGYAVNITPTLHGWLSIPVSGTPGHYVYHRVSSYTSQTSTFTSIGRVPAITAPPVARTVALVACSGTGGFYLAGEHLCQSQG